MAQIALNKPSGGQLLIQPEDGTSTETVTIPSVGVGKVLGYQLDDKFINISMTGTSGWVNTGLSTTYAPKQVGSTVYVKVTVKTSGTLNSGGVNYWGQDYQIRADSTRIGFLRHWVRDDNGSLVEQQLQTTIAGKFITTGTSPVTIDLQAATVSTSGATTQGINWWNANPTNGAQESYIEIVEVAA